MNSSFRLNLNVNQSVLSRQLTHFSIQPWLDWWSTWLSMHLTLCIKHKLFLLGIIFYFFCLFINPLFQIFFKVYFIYWIIYHFSLLNFLYALLFNKLSLRFFCFILFPLQFKQYINAFNIRSVWITCFFTLRNWIQLRTVFIH